MSKVKKVIDQTIINVRGAADSIYGAKVYTTEQVIMILEKLSEAAELAGDGDGACITSTDIYDLVERLEEKISDNISDMSEDGIVDTDTLEVSISGQRATVESLDVDKDNISSEAVCGIDDVISAWAYEYKILIED